MDGTFEPGKIESKGGDKLLRHKKEVGGRITMKNPHPTPNFLFLDKLLNEISFLSDLRKSYQCFSENLTSSANTLATF